MSQRHARPLMSLGVASYFIVLIILTLAALIPGNITLGLLLFIGPGLAFIVSPTLLYYSTALLPAYFINRIFGKRLLAAAVAAFCLAAAAVLPHVIDSYLLGRLVAADHSQPPTSVQPRSFQLPFPEGDNEWTNWRRPERRSSIPPPPCADLCQQLLFKGNVDEVVVRESAISDPLANGSVVITKSRVFRLNHDGSMDEITPGAPARTNILKPKWRRFRLERRDTCPDSFSLIAGQFVHDVVGGRCLIEDSIDSADADVVLSIAKADNRNQSKSRRIQKGPTTVTIAEQRDHRAMPVEVKTTLVAHDATLPFYFGIVRCGGSNIPDLCLAVARDPFRDSMADPFEMLGRRYGLAIASTPWASRLTIPVSDGDRAAVWAILKRDYAADGYIPMTQSRFVASFVNARLKSSELNEDDIALIRTLLKQRAFALSLETKLPPSAYQDLKPLLPDMFERIADRADGQSDMVQSLNEILGHFPAVDTDPYAAALCSERKNADLEVCYMREFRNAHKK